MMLGGCYLDYCPDILKVYVLSLATARLNR